MDMAPPDPQGSAAVPDQGKMLFDVEVPYEVDYAEREAYGEAVFTFLWA